MLILILRSQQEMEAKVKERRETIVKVKTKSTGIIAYLRVLRLYSLSVSLKLWAKKKKSLFQDAMWTCQVAGPLRIPSIGSGKEPRLQTESRGR